MAQFPETESEIAALAALMADGLEHAAADFPTPPVPPAELQPIHLTATHKHAPLPSSPRPRPTVGGGYRQYGVGTLRGFAVAATNCSLLALSYPNQ